MENDKKVMINKFKNWIMEIQFEFMENDLFLPVALELSCVPIIIETSEDYTFSDMFNENNNKIDEINYPLAYYKPSTDSIHVFIEHKTFQIRINEREKYALLMFILFHEAMHRLLMHIPRQNNRDGELWNIAADYEIHNTYFVFKEIMNSNYNLQNNNIHKYMKNYITKFLIDKDDKKYELGLFNKSFLNDTSEEIYQYLLNSKEEETYCFNDKSSKCVVKVTKYTLPNDETITTTNVEFSNDYNKKISNKNDDTEKNNSLTRKTLLQDKLNEYFKKSKGNLSESSQRFLKKLFHVKIDWKKILKASLFTSLNKDGIFSWSKPRTSMFALSNSPYLPSQIDTNSSFGTLIIVRDESGSITDLDCKKAISIISEAKDYYKQIIIIKHDTKISSIKKFDKVDDEIMQYLFKRESCGGTSHKEVFEYILNYIKNENEEDKISCCIFITDMMSDIEQHQDLIFGKVPMIYLANKNDIDNCNKNIKGIKIPIE